MLNTFASESVETEIVVNLVKIIFLLRTKSITSLTR